MTGSLGFLCFDIHSDGFVTWLILVLKKKIGEYISFYKHPVTVGLIALTGSVAETKSRDT